MRVLEALVCLVLGVTSSGLRIGVECKRGMDTGLRGFLSWIDHRVSIDLHLAFGKAVEYCGGC